MEISLDAHKLDDNVTLGCSKRSLRTYLASRRQSQTLRGGSLTSIGSATDNSPRKRRRGFRLRNVRKRKPPCPSLQTIPEQEAMQYSCHQVDSCNTQGARTEFLDAQQPDILSVTKHNIQKSAISKKDMPELPCNISLQLACDKSRSRAEKTRTSNIGSNPLKNMTIMLMHKLQGGDTHKLSQVAREMRSEAEGRQTGPARRIYDIVNVCEGAGLVVRSGIFELEGGDPLAAEDTSSACPEIEPVETLEQPESSLLSKQKGTHIRWIGPCSTSKKAQESSKGATLATTDVSRMQEKIYCLKEILVTKQKEAENLRKQIHLLKNLVKRNRRGALSRPSTSQLRPAAHVHLSPGHAAASFADSMKPAEPLVVPWSPSDFKLPECQGPFAGFPAQACETAHWAWEESEGLRHKVNIHDEGLHHKNDVDKEGGVKNPMDVAGSDQAQATLNDLHQDTHVWMGHVKPETMTPPEPTDGCSLTVAAHQLTPPMDTKDQQDVKDEANYSTPTCDVDLVVRDNIQVGSECDDEITSDLQARGTASQAANGCGKSQTSRNLFGESRVRRTIFSSDGQPSPRHGHNLWQSLEGRKDDDEELHCLENEVPYLSTPPGVAKQEAAPSAQAESPVQEMHPTCYQTHLNLPFLVLATQADTHVNVLMDADPAREVHLHLNQGYKLYDHSYIIQSLFEYHGIEE